MVQPSLWSMFRQSHWIVKQAEGPNDGLVSVSSSQWGEYKGTLQGVNHLDLINWTNRIRWLVWQLTGNKRKYALTGESCQYNMPKLTRLSSFNAIAFYLDITGQYFTL